MSLFAKPTGFLRDLLFAFGIAAVVFAGVLIATAQGFLQTPELFAYDKALNLQSGQQPESQRIVIVGATERDLQRFGYPLDDETLARLLEQVLKGGARTVGVDIYRDRPVGQGRAQLEQVIALSGRVVWVSKFQEGAGLDIQPPEVLVGTQRVGFSDVVLDQGGTVRRGLLFLDKCRVQIADNGVCPEREIIHATSFPLQVALRYLTEDQIFPRPDPQNPEDMRLGSSTMVPFEKNDGGYVDADARGYQVILDYKEDQGSFPTYSVSDVLDGEFPADSFKDRIVLVGMTAESVPDYLSTPLDRSFGVFVMAMLTSQIIRQALGETESIVVFGETVEWLSIAGLALLGACFGTWLRSLSLLLGCMIGGIVLLFAVYHYVFLPGTWLPIVPPLVAYVLAFVAAVLTVYSREYEIRRAFEKFLSPTLVKELAADPSQAKLGGERRELSFIFTDITDFTVFSDQTEPELLVRLLNEYFSGMCRIGIHHGGTIDKFVGDGVVVFFGAPIAQPDHADRAVACALEMDEFAQNFVEQALKEKIAFGATRIGVHTGEATVGNFGGTIFDYTAHGIAPCIASRLENWNKLIGTRICVSAETAEKAPKFDYRLIGKLSLKGVDKPQKAFELLARGAVGPTAVKAYREAYNLISRKSPKATDTFERLHHQFPKDPLIGFHAKRLAAGNSGEIIEIGQVWLFSMHYKVVMKLSGPRWGMLNTVVCQPIYKVKENS